MCTHAVRAEESENTPQQTPPAQGVHHELVTYYLDHQLAQRCFLRDRRRRSGIWASALVGRSTGCRRFGLGSARVAATAVSELTGRTMDITAERVAASFASINHLKVNGRRPERFAPMSGFHSTADGWIRLHANYPHHAKAYKDALGVTTDRAFAAQLATSRAKDIEAYIIAAGGVAAAMRSHQEWLTTPMAGASTSGPWINFMNAPTRHSATASIWRPPDDHSDAPLRDLRVLDFTRVIAGPSASRLLAALGADVLRVDSPNNPELLDQYIDTGF